MSNQRSRRRTEFETSRPAKNRKENERGGVIHNPDMAGYTDRKLLEELKARGFVWSDMKRIQPVKYDSI